MNGRLPNTPAGWHAFIDAWAQYHNVQMSEQARGALCNAFGNLTEAEMDAIQAHPNYERITVELPAHGTVLASTVTYRPQPAAEPLQSTAKPVAARPTRTPPRTAPSVPAPTGTRPPARIVRRTVPIK
jgi:hypothetical protein